MCRLGYVGRPIRRRARREPLFPSSLWNMHDRTLNDLPRTNNVSEGVNNGLNHLAGGSNLNFFKLIEVLKKNQDLQELKLIQLEAGANPVPKKSKYAQLDERLKKTVSSYENLTIPAFLKRIAINLTF